MGALWSELPWDPGPEKSMFPTPPPEVISMSTVKKRKNW